jgi:hypothetical protein
MNEFHFMIDFKDFAIILVGPGHISEQPRIAATDAHIAKERVLLRIRDGGKASVNDDKVSISESHLENDDSNRREMRASPAISKDPVTHLKKSQKTLKAESYEKKMGIAFKADYAFTGSYYNVHRNIMNFDPSDLLPEFNGN